MLYFPWNYDSRACAPTCYKIMWRRRFAYIPCARQCTKPSVWTAVSSVRETLPGRLVQICPLSDEKNPSIRSLPGVSVEPEPCDDSGTRFPAVSVLGTLVVALRKCFLLTSGDLRSCEWPCRTLCFCCWEIGVKSVVAPGEKRLQFEWFKWRLKASSSWCVSPSDQGHLWAEAELETVQGNLPGRYMGTQRAWEAPVEGKEREVPVQGKQKGGPCLCCSQVAVSVTAAHVWLERLGIVSAASLTLAANLIPAAFRKVVWELFLYVVCLFRFLG